MGHPVLDTMLRNQAAALAVCQADTKVEYEDDPKQAGRTGIRITGPTRGAVQTHMDLVHRKVDQAGTGYARFYGPAALGDGTYGALGEIILFVHAEAAE